MFRHSISLIALAMVACALVAAPSMATTWDAAADFSSVNNPNGQWTYGWGSSRVYDNYVNYTFTAYTLKQTTMIAGWGNAGPMLFAQTNAQNAPNLIKNVTATAQDIGGAGTALPYGLFVFPGTWGEGSIIRWTAVDAGTYDINSTFEFGHGPLAYSGWGAVIVNGNTVLQDSAISTTAPLTYTGSVTLSAGGTIDFIVTTPGAQYYHNGTRVAATVSTSSVPEPGSLLALSAGAMALLGFARRRKS